MYFVPELCQVPRAGPTRPSGRPVAAGTQDPSHPLFHLPPLLCVLGKWLLSFLIYEIGAGGFSS